jgi:hypothetical protein
MNPSAEQDSHSIPAPDTPASWRTLAVTPRAAEDQQQEVVGLVRTYDAGASFNNQEAPAAGVLSSIMAARVLSESDSPKKNPQARRQTQRS